MTNTDVGFAGLPVLDVFMGGEVRPCAGADPTLQRIIGSGRRRVIEGVFHRWVWLCLPPNSPQRGQKPGLGG